MSEITFAISANDKPNDLARLQRSIDLQQGSIGIEVLVGGPVAAAEVSRMRHQLFLQAQSPFVYFLDADCELPDEGFVLRLVKHLRREPNCAFGGHYLPAPDAGLLQRAYNSAANLWLKTHQATGQALPVAGNFVVPKFRMSNLNLPLFGHSVFGGEEVAVIEVLTKKGIPFKIHPDLNVTHHGTRVWTGFLGRAQLHGRAPKQKLRYSRMIRPLIHHLREEQPQVGLTVLLYLFVVGISRFFGGFRWLRG